MTLEGALAYRSLLPFEADGGCAVSGKALDDGGTTRAVGLLGSSIAMLPDGYKTGGDRLPANP